MFVFKKKLKCENLLSSSLLYTGNHCIERHQNLGGTSSNIDKCTKFEFNPSTHGVVMVDTDTTYCTAHDNQQTQGYDISTPQVFKQLDATTCQKQAL